MTDVHAERTLELAADVASALRARGAACAVIGAAAVAVHGYVRGTEDLDLATAAPLRILQVVAADLERRGYSVLLGEPDADDPLGGVLTIEAPDADPVQVVNYENPFRAGSGALARECIETAERGVLGSLAVVDLSHLVALKLYAGGPKSELDVRELLARNPSADRNAIRSVCARFGLAAEWASIRS